jgi:choline dehydrogenase-like flavoprotein
VKHFDCLVIGSGAAGSFAAKELTERGLEVLLLEAGPDIGEADFKPVPKTPVQARMDVWDRLRGALTGQHIQMRGALYNRQFKHLYVNDAKHPYSTPRDEPFLWLRGKQLGGRLHTYGRVLLRWSDYDFKAASRDGYGQDWPISYADLAPYYDHVEAFLGVYGNADGVRNLPDGNYVRPLKLTPAVQAFKAAVEARWPDRSVIPWRYMPPNIRRVPQPLLAAKETGRLTLRTNAIVRRITTDPVTGKATGAEFIDRLTKKTETVSANFVLVCASTIESVRLLLNSASSRHPHGLGNSSGLLGHYFMDQCPNIVIGTAPNSRGWTHEDPSPEDPFYAPTGGIYIPRFDNLDGVSHSTFLRGFGYQGSIGRLFVPDDKASKVGIVGFGEMLPYHDNRITLHPARKDAWGIPIPHIRCALHHNERELLREQSRSLIDMMANSGCAIEFAGSPLGLEETGSGAFPEASRLGKLLFRLSFKKSMAMGAAIHESGGARMGSDPATSVLNAYNQSWDVKNLFVTDASSFASSGTVGTTLTIMALTVRACDYIAREHGKGGL